MLITLKSDQEFCLDGLIIESEWVSLNESSYEKLEAEEEEEFADDSKATTFLKDAGAHPNPEPQP